KFQRYRRISARRGSAHCRTAFSDTRRFFGLPGRPRTAPLSRQRLCLIGQPGASDPSTVEHDAVEHLIHGAGRLRAPGLTHDFRRNAGDSEIVRYRFDDNRAGRDARAMADFDIPENLRARADHDAAPDLRMTVLVLLAGTAKRHIM